MPLYLTLIPTGTCSRRECGPFELVRIDGAEMFVNDSETCCLHLETEDWIVTDGAALGDAALTGEVVGLIWGQAKAQ